MKEDYVGREWFAGDGVAYQAYKSESDVGQARSNLFDQEVGRFDIGLMAAAYEYSCLVFLAPSFHRINFAGRIEEICPVSDDANV
jgi:hypothetical protein